MDKIILGESELFPGKYHKDMLLEMCIELVGDCYVNDNETIRFFEGASKFKDIPWFEVCMVHLPRAMATPNNRAHDIAVNLSYHLHDFFHHTKHPVDYLYSEFSDIRVWKK